VLEKSKLTYSLLVAICNKFVIYVNVLYQLTLNNGAFNNFEKDEAKGKRS